MHAPGDKKRARIGKSSHSERKTAHRTKKPPTGLQKPRTSRKKHAPASKSRAPRGKTAHSAENHPHRTASSHHAKVVNGGSEGGRTQVRHLGNGNILTSAPQGGRTEGNGQAAFRAPMQRALDMDLQPGCGTPFAPFALTVGPVGTKERRGTPDADARRMKRREGEGKRSGCESEYSDPIFLV